MIIRFCEYHTDAQCRCAVADSRFHFCGRMQVNTNKFVRLKEEEEQHLHIYSGYNLTLTYLKYSAYTYSITEYSSVHPAERFSTPLYSS